MLLYRTAYTQDLSYYEPLEWYVPVADLIKIYTYAPNYVNKTVNASAIEDCSLLFATGSLAIKDFGALIYPEIIGPAPFLSESFMDYFLGGMDDNAAWSSFMWNRSVASCLFLS
jgi:hypothetical protein